MDFTDRGAQRAQSVRPNAQAGASTQASASIHNPKKSGFYQPGWLRIATVVLLFSLTILVAGVVVLLYTGNPSESKYLDKRKYQAIFLSTGQVYFGSLKTISTSSLNLQNVFYLNQQAQGDSGAQKDSSNNLSLVKLGCEIHGPLDQMIINRDQVTFWENIRDDGQVVKAIKSYIKQNPNGQQCNQAQTTQQPNAAAPSTATSTSNNTATSAKKP